MKITINQDEPSPTFLVGRCSWRNPFLLNAFDALIALPVSQRIEFIEINERGIDFYLSVRDALGSRDEVIKNLHAQAQYRSRAAAECYRKIGMSP